jgi:hypothetical protein
MTVTSGDLTVSNGTLSAVKVSAGYLGITSSGGIAVSSGGISCTGYNVNGGYFGQDATAGLVCGSHTLYFKGGVLYAWV